jgi:hypothetical protein
MTIVTEHQRTHRQLLQNINAHTDGERFSASHVKGKSVIPLFTTSFFIWPPTPSSLQVLRVFIVHDHTQWPTRARAHARTRTHSVGLLQTSDQPEAETSTWQHIIRDTAIHAPGGIRNRKTRKSAKADPRLIPRGHWDRRLRQLIIYKCRGLKASERCWWRLNYFDKRFGMNW